MIADIPELQVDECAGLIELTQANGLDMPDCIRLHPLHVKYLAERFGLVETSDPLALKTIATLKGRLLALKPRIDHLAEFLDLYSDHKHANLSYERDYASATADICEAFCDDLDDFEADIPEKRPVQEAQIRVSLPQVQAPASRQRGTSAKSAAARAKDYRARKRSECNPNGVTEKRDASRDGKRDAAVTPPKQTTLELRP